jgi:hypothetical protein
MKNSHATVAASLLAAAIALASSVHASGDLPQSSPTAASPAGSHDFDFLIGDWRIHHTLLKDRLTGCHEWFEFDGTSSMRPMMGGWGNVDDNVLNRPGGAYRAMTVRAFDPVSGQWAIWWVDGRNPFGDLDPPVKGRFQDGVGTFYADDTFRGKPVRVRFTWSRITPTSIHWEQAFSPDGGKTWETNWKSDFARVR